MKTKNQTRVQIASVNWPKDQVKIFEGMKWKKEVSLANNPPNKKAVGSETHSPSSKWNRLTKESRVAKKLVF